MSFNQQPEEKKIKELSYSEFNGLLEKHHLSIENKVDDSNKITITEVTIQEKVLVGEYKDITGFHKFKCVIPQIDYKFIEELSNKNIKIVKYQHQEEAGFWSNFLFSWGPMLLFILFLWFVFYRNIIGGGKGAFSFGKSRAKLFISNLPKVTFSDVAGCEEAKKELEEIIDFLKDPKKFQRLGGRIPKGVLVVGPPGTGKTLLARAVAGEAGVPFLSISGSDFVEMFVGVGASRVRDLFEQGKKHAPCIIFIDEIDAVGRQRGAGLGGGHDEREQTLNALLVEMDGFETNEGVILIAATNRPDVLDPALLRPGRFDRNVIVDNPDLKGRVGILKVHSKKIPLDINIDLEVIARGCPGFSGADLENLMNEAALLAARKNLDVVTMSELEDAKDKVIMGPARRSLVIKDKEKKETAYHEAGHALVAEMIPGTDPLHKITIIPRGRALGATIQLPEEEKHSHSKEILLGKIAVFMGGRAAENLVFSAPTTGAANDIERATLLARKMVCEWGMSEKIGPVQFGKREEHPFLGRELSYQKDHSESTGIDLDSEIKRIVTGQYELAEKILRENRTTLDKIAEILLLKETIEGDEVRALIRGENIDAINSHQAEKEKTNGIPIGMTTIDNATTFTIAGTMFNSLESALSDDAKNALIKIGKIIKEKIEADPKKYEKKQPRIEILGYTDSLGSIDANKTLSQKRADSVKQFITGECGINSSLIAAIGKGDSEPIGDNATAEGRAKNRRIKILFIEPTKEEQAAKVLDGLVSKVNDRKRE